MLDSSALILRGDRGLSDVQDARGVRDRPGAVHGEEGAFTDAEERAVGLAEVVPFLLASRLVERGATHSGAADFQPHVVRDGRLITGQNPASAAGVAMRMLDALSG